MKKRSRINIIFNRLRMTLSLWGSDLGHCPETGKMVYVDLDSAYRCAKVVWN